MLNWSNTKAAVSAREIDAIVTPSNSVIARNLPPSGPLVKATGLAITAKHHRRPEAPGLASGVRPDDRVQEDTCGVPK